jgi:hypothetical protein
LDQSHQELTPIPKYNDGTSLWDAQWQKNQGPKGDKVFGYFYSTWGINFTLAGNADPDKLGNVLAM